MKNLIKFTHFLIIILIFVFSLLFFQYKQATIPYHADEYTWVGRSYFFDLFIHRKFNDSLWNSYHAYDQPMLVHYIYGAYLYPHYLHSRKYSYIEFLLSHSINQLGNADTPTWNTVQDAYNQFNNNPITCTSIYCKSILLIYKVRLLNIVLLSFSCILIYLTTQLLLNRVYSVITTVIWALNPIIWSWGIRAVGEATFLLFFSLSLYLLLFIYTKNKQTITFFIILAVSFALCFSTKIHGLLLPFIFIIFMFLNTIWKHDDKKNIEMFRELKRLSIVIIIFLLITLFLNPYLWSDPFNHVLTLFRHRLDTSQLQAQIFPQSALTTVQQRVFSIYYILFGSIQQSTMLYPQFFLPISLTIFTTGILYISSNIKTKFLFFFMFIVILLLIFMSIVLPLAWERYYNILIFPLSLILVLGIKYIYDSTSFVKLLHKKYFK